MDSISVFDKKHITLFWNFLYTGVCTAFVLPTFALTRFLDYNLVLPVFSVDILAYIYKKDFISLVDQKDALRLFYDRFGIHP